LVSRGAVLPNFSKKAQIYADNFFIENKVELYVNTTYDEEFQR
jgi:hypothetical protein